MKNMNWKQLWTSYPPAESPRRLDFFWVDELPWSLKASSGRSLPSIACHTKARKITSKHGNSRELQKATNIMMIMMSFFSGTPFFFCHSIFSVKKKPGKPRIFRRFKFHHRIFLGGRFLIIQPWLHIPSRLMAPIRADPDYWPTCGNSISQSYSRSQNSQLGVGVGVTHLSLRGISQKFWFETLEKWEGWPP